MPYLYAKKHPMNLQIYNEIIKKRKSFLGLNFNIPQIIGVLNITPDSFSDGGLFFDEFNAYKQADLMLKNGANIIDVGGESTRPGSDTINYKITNNGNGEQLLKIVP